MAVWNTEPIPTQAKAFLGTPEINAIFNFNPDEVKWSYKNNTVSRDTIGGRVVQILSSSVDGMTVIGRSGSRNNLQVFSNNLKRIMQFHIKTGDPVDFKVPSRNWHFKVYVQNISGLGWDVTATSYPYQITLMIQDDLSNLIGYELKEDVFLKLINGIGYNSKFHGGDVSRALTYAEATLNAINSVDVSSGKDNGGTEETGKNGKTGSYKAKETGGGGNATLTRALLAKADLSSVPQVSKERFITVAEIYALSYWALDQLGNLTGDNLKQAAIVATAISYCETRTHDTEARNDEATNGTAFGLWQMGEGFGTSLFDPVVAALHMAEKYYASKWLYWGCGPDHESKKYEDFMDEARSAAS